LFYSFSSLTFITPFHFQRALFHDKAMCEPTADS